MQAEAQNRGVKWELRAIASPCLWARHVGDVASDRRETEIEREGEKEIGREGRKQGGREGRRGGWVGRRGRYGRREI